MIDLVNHLEADGAALVNHGLIGGSNWCRNKAAATIDAGAGRQTRLLEIGVTTPPVRTSVSKNPRHF
jgi:hypothetical protein